MFCATSCGGNSAIKFKGGTCELSVLEQQSMFAPSDMKDNEKAFMVRFLYKLDEGVSNDALGVLYDNGQFIATDGTTYKAGVAAVNDSLYSLIVAVPKDLDVESLKFKYDNQTISLKK